MPFLLFYADVQYFWLLFSALPSILDGMSDEKSETDPVRPVGEESSCKCGPCSPQTHTPSHRERVYRKTSRIIHHSQKPYDPVKDLDLSRLTISKSPHRVKKPLSNCFQFPSPVKTSGIPKQEPKDHKEEDSYQRLSFSGKTNPPDTLDFQSLAEQVKEIEVTTKDRSAATWTELRSSTSKNSVSSKTTFSEKSAEATEESTDTLSRMNQSVVSKSSALFRSCSQEARLNELEFNADELASYFDELVHIPKKMSEMAEMMYT